MLQAIDSITCCLVKRPDSINCKLEVPKSSSARESVARRASSTPSCRCFEFGAATPFAAIEPFRNYEISFIAHSLVFVPSFAHESIWVVKRSINPRWILFLAQFARYAGGRSYSVCS